MINYLLVELVFILFMLHLERFKLLVPDANLGINTVSITWITPLVQTMSV